MRSLEGVHTQASSQIGRQANLGGLTPPLAWGREDTFMPITPPYLTPAGQLTAGVRVRTAPDAPRERDGAPQSNRFFPGCLAWSIEISLIMSEHTSSDGAVEREVRRTRVTVWAPERPKVEADDIVIFQGVMAGAVDGSVFLQATGVEKLEEAGSELL